jgi:hypothetical protein
LKAKSKLVPSVDMREALDIDAHPTPTMQSPWLDPHQFFEAVEQRVNVSILSHLPTIGIFRNRGQVGL